MPFRLVFWRCFLRRDPEIYGDARGSPGFADERVRRALQPPVLGAGVDGIRAAVAFDDDCANRIILITGRPSC